MKYVPVNYYTETINGSEKNLLTFFLTSALRQERGGKEVTSSESKEERSKIDCRKIKERKKRKTGVGRK